MLFSKGISKEGKKEVIMTGETMYASRIEELMTLVLDTIVFLARSVFFICESLVLSVVPDRFRKLKVSACDRIWHTCNLIAASCAVSFYFFFLDFFQI